MLQPVPSQRRQRVDEEEEEEEEREEPAKKSFKTVSSFYTVHMELSLTYNFRLQGSHLMSALMMLWTS